jgi:hypothetical protein
MTVRGCQGALRLRKWMWLPGHNTLMGQQGGGDKAALVASLCKQGPRCERAILYWSECKVFCAGSTERML